MGRGLLLGLAVFAASCADDNDPVSRNRTPTAARYAPSEGDIPIPNDLLYANSTDATLNIPIDPTQSTASTFTALNTLDGWSPVAPANVVFSRPLDPATVLPGDTVRMFEVTVSTADGPVGGPVTAIDRELIAGVDFVAVVSNDSNVAIQPLVPLTPSTASDPSVYMIVLTNGIQDTSGIAVAKDTEYLFASQETAFPDGALLEPLRLLVDAQLTNFATQPNAVRDDVVVSFTYTVQSVGSTLGTLSTIAQGNEAAVIAGLCGALGTCDGDTAVDPLSTAVLQVNAMGMSIGTASELAGGGAGIADMYVGVLESPYYLTQADNPTTEFSGLTNDATPLSASFAPRYDTVTGATDSQLSRLNPLPAVTTSQRMPVLVSVPQGAVPPDGFPIVIFQHGIGGNRTNLLGIAEALAADGLAAVAIDLPLHGVDETTGMLAGGVSVYTGFRQVTMGTPADVWERTFGMDLLTESGGTTTPGPDGVADSSGAHFINLSNVAVSRDNIRQGVADLFNLKESLGSLTVMGADMFDETEVHFIGHSLGGIVGTPFLAVQPGMTAATLGMPGSSIPYLLNGSTFFGPTIQAGLLAAAGLEVGTADYDQFLAAAQTVIDSADPINYASTLAAGNLPLLLIEVIGGGAQGGVADVVIPNSVAGAPFAGTEPMISALGLIDIVGDTADAGGIQGAVRFIEGSHGSLLTPVGSAGDAAAFAEMQAQVRSFHVSDGQNLDVTDATLIQQ
jgi:pimeloyl-ACP methyl ester carboxylesterase